MAHHGLRMTRFDEKKLSREVAARGTLDYLIDWAINEPWTFAGFLEWDKDVDAAFTFTHNEVQYVMSGKGKYIYTSHPEHMDEQTVAVEEGDLIRIRIGTSLRVEVVERPFRVSYAIMPAPEVPYVPFDTKED